MCARIGAYCFCAKCVYIARAGHIYWIVANDHIHVSFVVKVANKAVAVVESSFAVASFLALP